MFRGSLTALVTPFDKAGRLDEKAFVDFVEWQIGEGTRGLVPVGTTGESPTLSHDEHRRIVKLCVETAKGRVPVIAGAGYVRNRAVTVRFGDSEEGVSFQAAHRPLQPVGRS